MSGIGINQLIENMERLDVREIVGDSLEATKGEIVEFQKGQMLSGEASDGDKIGKYKSKDYARNKYNQNPRAGYGNVDLKLEGPFQLNIKAVVFSDSLHIFSTDEKNDDLVNKYGLRIFGLNVPYTAEYVRLYLEPEANKRFKEKIYGTL
jgi:hypothetical protein